MSCHYNFKTYVSIYDFIVFWGKNNWNWEVQTDPWGWANVRSLVMGPKSRTTEGAQSVKLVKV